MHGILGKFLLTAALCLLMASQVAQLSLHLSSDVLVMLHHPPSFSRRSVCWWPGISQTPITSRTGFFHSKNTCPLRQDLNLCGIKRYCTKHIIFCRSQWPRGLRRRSLAARLLRLWVRIPPGTWMFVCCKCCVLSGRGLCDGVIIRPEESYRLWRVVVCKIQPPMGVVAPGEKKSIFWHVTPYSVVEI